MPSDEIPNGRGLKVLADKVTVALVERVLNQDQQIAELQRRLDETEKNRDGLKWFVGAGIGFIGILSKFIVDYFRPPPNDRIG